MVSKNKDKEILIHQAEAFLDYSENAWNIRNHVKKGIIDVLKWDDVDIYEKMRSGGSWFAAHS